MTKITIEDRRMIHYFHSEKGDITRWVHWNQKKGLIAVEYPELIAAMDNLSLAEKTLDRIVSSILYDGDDDE